jgi:hypothetical protein
MKNSLNKQQEVSVAPIAFFIRFSSLLNTLLDHVGQSRFSKWGWRRDDVEFG